jgi:Fe-S-cluster containining protein
MRRDSLILRIGYAGSAVLATIAFLIGLGWAISLVTFAVALIVVRVSVYAYFERYLAFGTFNNFVSGTIRYGCIACGASCHLRVNLRNDDAERILKYAKEKGIQEAVIEKSGNKLWLKRRPDSSCIFLTYSGKVPRCSIYSIRPMACRLYPLVPSGSTLKADPMCPGFSKTRGGSFKEHLSTQGIATHVRQVLGKSI